jgi:hypothetical protein
MQLIAPTASIAPNNISDRVIFRSELPGFSLTADINYPPGFGSPDQCVSCSIRGVNGISSALGNTEFPALLIIKYTIYQEYHNVKRRMLLQF